MENKNNYKAWLYLAPTLILLGLFTFYPLINTFLVSFMKGYEYDTGYFEGFTLDNYGIILDIIHPEATQSGMAIAPYFVKYALPNTFFIAIITVPLSILISLGIAVLLNSIKPLRGLFQTIFFTPYVTNIIAVGMVFSVIFADNGLFNNIFNTVGTSWVSTHDLTWGRAMFVLCLQIIWYECPYKILILLGGLQGIDKQYYETAKVDAVPKWRVLTKVTIPLLSPQIFYLSITSFIGAFKEYQSIVGLFGRHGTSGDTSYDLYTCAYYIYDILQNETNLISYAAAGSVVLFLIILAFTILQLWIGKKKVHY